MAWSISFLPALRATVVVFAVFIVLLVIIDLVMISRISTHVQDITRLWKDQPIVSVYASSSIQGETCSEGFEILPLSYVALPFLSQASCGCTQNPYGYSSSVASCFAQNEHSGYCMSLDALSPVPNFDWRGSTLCIKRAGRPAATYKGHYSGRPHPNKHGKCPNKYKKCGEGKNQDEGAICFPDNTECPITNIMVLPSAVSPPSNEGWEPAGFFLNDDSALFVRREHIGELPIMNLTVALTDLAEDLNLRGQCFRGEPQHLAAPIQASKSELWKYSVALPPACETSDPRYILADNITLVDGYLRGLEASEPACAGFQLLSLDDPRYNRSSDPDYLNSGVKCGSDPRYSCVRDPHQRTDCIAGDEICDGVINQNICGEYAHAVRSAFSASAVTLGLYYIREIEWSDHCTVSKKSIFNYRKIPEYLMEKFGWGVGLFLFFSFIVYTMPEEVSEGEPLENSSTFSAYMFVCYILFPMFGSLIATMVKMCQLYSVYKAMGSGQCTDDFTAEIIMSRLTPTFLIYFLTWALFTLILVTSVMIVPLMCSKKLTVRPAPVVAAVTAASTTVVQATNIELLANVQAARAVQSTPSSHTAAVARENRVSKYGPLSTEEV